MLFECVMSIVSTRSVEAASEGVEVLVVLSRAAGAAYHDRLLALPAFLIGDPQRDAPSAAELVDAFRLTRYFLDRLVFGPRGVALPEARDRFIGAIARL